MVSYGTLADLAQVNEALLQGAAKDQLLEKIKKLREQQERFESAIQEYLNINGATEHFTETTEA